MKMNIFLLLLIMSGIMSCDTGPIEIDKPPKSDTEPDSLLVWKVPLHEDTLNSNSIDQITLYRDRVVTSVKPSFGNEDETLLCYDTTGMLQWSWNDYEPYRKILSISDEGSIDNYFFFTTWYQNFCIDIISGEEKWRYINEYGDPRINGSDHNFIFKPIWFSQSSPRSDSTAIYMSHATNGDFQEIFKIKRTVGDAVNIPIVGSYLSPNDKLVAIFQNNTLYMPPEYKETIDLYSYDITNGELMWKVSDINAESWNIHIPQIDEDNIYFATKYRMFSFDKETGEQNWERLMPHDFQGSNYLLYNDLLITNLDNGDLIAISKHTGETVWHNKKLSACCVKLRIYDGKVYFGNGDLFIVDADTGELLHRYRSSTRKEKGRSNAFFLNAIAVDTENQRMYATDSYYLMCLKHPDL